MVGDSVLLQVPWVFKVPLTVMEVPAIALTTALGAMVSDAPAGIVKEPVNRCTTLALQVWLPEIVPL